MRRWNGWGEDGVEAPLPDRARDLLVQLVGPGTPTIDARLEDVVASVAPSRLVADDGWTTDARDRVLHARGQSLPDWVALRSGRLERVPDAVARPSSADEVRAVLERARASEARIIPYGGATSVVGGVTAHAGEAPIVSVDLAATAGLRSLDETSGLATFGAGTTGPALEAALEPFGRTLGHYPQSFERSTVGGWVVTRSAGQESSGVGRIEALFAGGHLEAPTGPLDLPTHPASAAGPDLRQLVLGSEGRLGILTDVIVRTSLAPQASRVNAFVMRDWDAALPSRGPWPSDGSPCRWSAWRRRSRPRRRSPSSATAGARRCSVGISAGAGSARTGSAASCWWDSRVPHPSSTPPRARSRGP